MALVVLVFNFNCMSQKADHFCLNNFTIFPFLQWSNALPPIGLFQGILAVIDCTECSIVCTCNWTVQNFFYLGKKKKWTFKYEIAVSITDGIILWISGPTWKNS